MMVDCKNPKCSNRLRADQLNKAKCPKCGGTEFTDERGFNLMLKTSLGAMEDSSSVFI